jgi:hypothetical protein
MTQNDRKLYGFLAFKRTDVTAADATSLHFDAHLAWARMGQVYFMNLKAGISGEGNGGVSFHL